MGELYEDTYRNKQHFSFGKNWLSFLKHVDAQRMKKAQESLTEFLGEKNLKGKTFIDVGCGSGLFSLAAYTLGTKKLVSVDADANSVRATKALQAKVKPKNWTVKHGSVLDKKFVQSLGTYDTVYSWGVLHHTGDMYAAFDNVDVLVKKGGVLFIAIYNDNQKHVLEGTSGFWLKTKRFYNNTNKPVKRMLEFLYSGYLLAAITATGRNPMRYVKEYKEQRGMEFHTDIKDWLGGYPYEYATPKQITSYFDKKHYKLLKQKTVRSIGCNEFVFQKTRL